MTPLSVLRDAWYFSRNNLLAIASLTLPLLVLEATAQVLLAAQLGAGANPAYGILLGILFYPLYAGPLILFLHARSNGQAPGNAQLLAAGLQLWPRFALLAGISTLAIMLGLSLMIVPGIWVMVRLAFAELVLVLHQETPLRALQASVTMTAGRFWPVLTCLLSVLAPLWLLDALTTPPPSQTLLWVIQQSVSGFLQLFALIVLFRLFMLFETQQNRA
ncbi:YciC family protein [Pseudomonas sp. 8Z]|uniref:YciC family protein n=1 Tax=Pseudomonas sp. 8Z TaxID=2653166 RepID=UPI001356A139|nr:YciC family protein [Pseudomonas sp. 8Z]